MLVAVFLVICTAFTYKICDRNTPVCRLRASYHLSAVRAHYGCGTASTAALTVTETASVKYHTAMYCFFSSVAELKQERPIELARIGSYRH
jgi:hypothetical protein